MSPRPAAADASADVAADVRFGWGEHGLRDAGAGARSVVVVDVLSFSTTVSVATGRGAEVWPATGSGERVAAVAMRHGAELAGPRRDVTPAHPYSLSPVSVLRIAPGTRLVLASPNGAHLCDAARDMGPTVMVGCLRNAAAVASAAAALGPPVAVVAAGERWADGSLRPAYEDLVGAGAVVAHLVSSHGLVPSPDARAAAGARAAATMTADLASCPSGVELARAGFPDDVALAGEVDVDDVAPVMGADGWIRHGTGDGSAARHAG